jgi:hypothetical protein
MSRCYTTAQVLDRLQLRPSTFRDLKRAGQLPWVQEIVPRMGRTRRYKAEPIDRYLAGLWGKSTFGSKVSA